MSAAPDLATAAPDLATAALELADTAVAALLHHGDGCPACEAMLDDRITLVEEAMRAALRDALAGDEEEAA